MSAGPLLTVAQVAEQLQKSEQFVIAELKRTNLAGARLGRTWRVQQSAVDTYVDAHLNVRPIRRRKTA